MAVADHVGGHGADKGVEGLRADRVHDAIADLEVQHATADGLDEPTREAFLMALSNAGSREAAEVARTAKGKTSRLGEGQIAVLSARNAASLTPQELDDLMLVVNSHDSLMKAAQRYMAPLPDGYAEHEDADACSKHKSWHRQRKPADEAERK